MNFYLTVLILDLMTGQHYMYEGYYPTYDQCDIVKQRIDLIFKQQEVKVLINNCDQIV